MFSSIYWIGLVSCEVNCGLFWFKVLDEDGSVVPHGQEGDLGIRVKPDRPFSLFTEYTVRFPFSHM